MTSASLQAELTAAFDAAGRAGLKITECPHCEERFSGGELLCDCEAVIDQFGATCCADCGITYGLCPSVAEYIDMYEDAEDGEEMAYDCYAAKLKFNAPKPCSKCSQEYQTYHSLLTEKYVAFKASYEKRHAAEWAEQYGWDDEPCTSHRGMCRCCGDCP